MDKPTMEDVLTPTEREFLETDTGCHLPGWDGEPGGPGYLCELEDGHEGPHAAFINPDPGVYGESDETREEWEVG
jgi:hypothetical protein